MVESLMFHANSSHLVLRPSAIVQNLYALLVHINDIIYIYRRHIMSHKTCLIIKLMINVTGGNGVTSCQIDSIIEYNSFVI